MARSSVSLAVLFLVVAALLVSCAESRILSSGLLGSRVPIRPANVTVNVNISPSSVRNSVADLKSALQAHIVSLQAALKQSIHKLASALKDHTASPATSALQAQIAALQTSITALNTRIANLELVTSVTVTTGPCKSQATVTSSSGGASLLSQISSLRASIPAMSKRVTSLNTDLVNMLLPGLRALLGQKLPALTQRVGALNLDASTMVAQVDAFMAPLTKALGVTSLMALLPQQAGMLRGIMTSCGGQVQVGAANIQITKIGMSYTFAYYLIAEGVADAPQSQAIYHGSACSADSSASVQLTGTWKLQTAATWTLANVMTIGEGELADLLGSIQTLSNGDLYIGVMGSSSSLSGKLVGGKL